MTEDENQEGSPPAVAKKQKTGASTTTNTAMPFEPGELSLLSSLGEAEREVIHDRRSHWTQEEVDFAQKIMDYFVAGLLFEQVESVLVVGGVSRTCVPSHPILLDQNHPSCAALLLLSSYSKWMWAKTIASGKHVECCVLDM